MFAWPGPSSGVYYYKFVCKASKSNRWERGRIAAETVGQARSDITVFYDPDWISIEGVPVNSTYEKVYNDMSHGGLPLDKDEYEYTSKSVQKHRGSGTYFEREVIKRKIAPAITAGGASSGDFDDDDEFEDDFDEDDFDFDEQLAKPSVASGAVAATTAAKQTAPPEPKKPELITCKACGTKNKAGDKFCGNCGADEAGMSREAAASEPAAVALQVKTIYCGSCGAANKSTDKFCGDCGAKP